MKQTAPFNLILSFDESNHPWDKALSKLEGVAHEKVKACIFSSCDCIASIRYRES